MLPNAVLRVTFFPFGKRLLAKIMCYYNFFISCSYCPVDLPLPQRVNYGINILVFDLIAESNKIVKSSAVVTCGNAQNCQML